jgi:hypothetical protein
LEKAAKDSADFGENAFNGDDFYNAHHMPRDQQTMLPVRAR